MLEGVNLRQLTENRSGSPSQFDAQPNLVSKAAWAEMPKTSHQWSLKKMPMLLVFTYGCCVLMCFRWVTKLICHWSNWLPLKMERFVVDGAFFGVAPLFRGDAVVRLMKPTVHLAPFAVRTQSLFETYRKRSTRSKTASSEGQFGEVTNDIW